MFHDTTTFRADFGTNLAIDAKHARRHYTRTFHDLPRMYSHAIAHFTEHAMAPSTAGLAHPAFREPSPGNDSITPATAPGWRDVANHVTAR